jgi:hypothetical protein
MPVIGSSFGSMGQERINGGYLRLAAGRTRFGAAISAFSSRLAFRPMAKNVENGNSDRCGDRTAPRNSYEKQ